jgi:hypothetical protein
VTDFILYFGLLSESLMGESKLDMNYHEAMKATLQTVRIRKCDARIIDLPFLASLYT